MLTRGAKVGPTTTLRAMVPVSVRSDDPVGAGPIASTVESLLVDLPIGEPNPTVRLQQVSYQMKAHADTGRAVPARRLAEVGGFAPSTLHSLGARVASGLSRRVFNLVVTNVPGPQNPVYAAGAELVAGYPVIPLAKGQGLAIGLTSYRGGVFYGLNADREAMPDLDVLAQCIVESLTELRDTVP
jgi:WS/DGAT/MGAT family acyltransferase